MSGFDENMKPYNYDENDVFMLQVLRRGRWVFKGRGKLDNLERALKWKEICDNARNAIRIRKLLSNGQWFSAWCASTPYVALLAIIRYLKEKVRV